jgi:hypothetical protein
MIAPRAYMLRDRDVSTDSVSTDSSVGQDSHGPGDINLKLREVAPRFDPGRE